MNDPKPTRPFERASLLEAFRALAANAPEHHALIDRERRIVEVNSTTQLAREDVIGKRLDDILRTDDMPRVREAVSRAFETGEHVAYESVLKRRTGRGRGTIATTSSRSSHPRGSLGSLR